MKKRIISLLTIAAILGTSIPLSSEDVKSFADSIKGIKEPLTIRKWEKNLEKSIISTF